MQIFSTKANIEAVLASFIKQKKTIGFVPTMGALHQGHLSLIARAIDQNDHVVVSIFVNPLQFNNKADLDTYPRTQQEDMDLLREFNKDILLYIPDVSEIYENTSESESFDFDGLDTQLEGKFRPGHFDGVGAVLKRFFLSLQPTRVYLGEKDFQQLQIVRKLVEKEGLPVQVIACPIYREKSGLAYSSRNKRLSKRHMKEAPFIYQILKQVHRDFGTKNALELKNWVFKAFESNQLLELEYFEIADEATLTPISEKNTNATYRAFIAVFAGEVRLIDTMALN